VASPPVQKEPAGHGAHQPLAFLAYPGMQLQKLLSGCTDVLQPTSEQLHSLWLVEPAGEVAPAGHESQTVMFVVGAKEPAGHGWKPPSTFPKKPGAATQSARTTELWWIVVEPAGQASHAALLNLVLKKPTAHDSHAAPSYPAMHTQSCEFTVPLSTVHLLTPQAQQPWASAQPLPPVEALRTASLKVPCGHAAHAPLSSRKPALQRQELAAVPVAGCEFAGQAMQAASLVCPVNAEYVPAVQALHATLPVAGLYFPASHGAHGPPSGPE
jgi:hypothetical protein